MEPEHEKKPTRQGLPNGLSVADVTFDIAVELLALPRDVGAHPDTGEMITAGIGRYGPFVKHQSTYKSIPKDEDVLTIGLNRAVELLSQAGKGGGGFGAAAKPIKELGEHPQEGGAIGVYNGRYGPYVKWGKVNATLPKEVQPEQITLDQAVEIISKKQASKKKKPKKAPAKKKKKA